MAVPMCWLWCLAASLGCMPPSGGTCTLMWLARTSCSLDTMPIPRLSAVDSIPRDIKSLNSDKDRIKSYR